MHPDRLAELQRQRDLVRSHLAWLEQEIAAGSASGAAPMARPEKSPVAPPAAAIASSPSALPFAPPSPDPVGSADNAKRGCLIVAGLVLVLGLLGLVAIYFLRYNGRPLV